MGWRTPSFLFSLALWVGCGLAQRHPSRIRLQLSRDVSESYLDNVRQLYQTSEDIYNGVQSICRRNSYMTCHSYKHLQYVVIQGNQQNDEYALFVFGQHARELFTSTTALAWLKRLDKHQPNANIILLPNVNPINRNKVLEGQLCIRKNEHGVDLNRAYALPDFASRVDYGKFSEEYQGVSPMREMSTQLVDYIVDSFRIKMVCNVHTGEFSAYLGGSDSSMTMHMPHDKRHVAIMANITKDLCPECAVGAAAATSSYTATGTLCDYLKFNRGVPVAITFEIFGDFERGRNCFEWFNPKTKTQRDTHMRRWMQIFERVVDTSLTW